MSVMWNHSNIQVPTTSLCSVDGKEKSDWSETIPCTEHIRDPKEELPTCGSDYDEVSQVITGSFKFVLEARRLPVVSYGQNCGGRRWIKLPSRPARVPHVVALALLS